LLFYKTKQKKTPFEGCILFTERERKGKGKGKGKEFEV